MHRALCRLDPYMRKRAIIRPPVEKSVFGPATDYGAMSSPEPVDPSAPLLSRTRVSDCAPA